MTICAAILVGSARTIVAPSREGVEAVRADDREQRRAERNEQVRAQPGLALAQLTLEADQPAEHRGEREPQSDSPQLRVGTG